MSEYGFNTPLVSEVAMYGKLCLSHRQWPASSGTMENNCLIIFLIRFYYRVTSAGIEAADDLS